MDHAHAEDHDVVESYLADRLSESERASFEAHYFDCETCLSRLETTNDLREGLRQVAAEDLARATVAATVARGWLAGIAALSRRHPWALVGAWVVLAALPCFFWAERDHDLRRQWAATAAGAERQRALLEARLQGLEQGEERGSGVQPQGNVPLFTLAAVRGTETADREPVNQLPLAESVAAAVLTVELATSDAAEYRASLWAASGQEVWQSGALHPDSRDTLVLLLPGRMLQPGVYRLTIEGVDPQGRRSAVAVYPFRVRRP